VAVYAAAICVDFSFSPRKDPAYRSGKPSTWSTCFELDCSVHCPENTRPLAPATDRGPLLLSGACAADSVSVRYSKWRWIWVPADVCMASGRFAWISGLAATCSSIQRPCHALQTIKSLVISGRMYLRSCRWAMVMARRTKHGIACQQALGAQPPQRID
jgi:hypothetical protein